MPLFGRRRNASTGVGHLDESGFAGEAPAHGLEPVSGAVLDEPLEDAVREIARVLHGSEPDPMSVVASQPNHYRMNFHDAFRADLDGRRIIVANGAITVNPGLVGTGLGTRGVAVCVVELPSILALACVQPRRYRHRVIRHLPESPTGNAAFDERFSVTVWPGLPPTVLTPDMQRLLMARDDWIFRAERNQLICVTQDPFGSVDEMLHRRDDVMAIVAAIPTTVLAARVDHSEDDLIARIGQLDSVEDAIAFLQHLTPTDRERLARSDTPLASFADVTTPEEAMARFQALDPSRQMQLISMFENVEDS